MLAFIGAHSLPLAAIALAGYLVLGAVMPIASSKLCGNAGRASRDAAGSISAYVLDGLRGLAETVQFAGVSKRSAGLAAQTDHGLHGPLPARALRCGRGPGGCVGAAHQPRHDRDVAGAFRSGRPLVLVRVRGVSEARGALRGAGAASSGAPVHSSACALPSKDDRILDDVSIAFEPGEMVCVTGRSDSGKSTLLKLLMRFWDPTSGAVKMSGRDLRGVNTVSLRSSIGYMTQDTHLFVGTIGDNLRIARELVSHRSSTCAFADRFYSVERGRIS